MNTMKWQRYGLPLPAVLLLLMVALLGAGGCSMLPAGEPGEPSQEITEEVKPQDEPPVETEEQAEVRRKAEEARIAEEKREVEEARLAEEKRQSDETQRRADEVREAFGPIPEKPPVTTPEAPPPGGTTGETMVAGAAATDQAADQTAASTTAPPAPVSPRLIPFDEGVPPLPEEPVLRVAVLSEEDQPEKGAQVALTLGTYNRARIEDRLGVAIKIAYISLLKDTGTSISAIRFRPSFMKAALVVASELPHQQIIGPMTPNELRQDSVDLLVYIGPNYR